MASDGPRFLENVYFDFDKSVVRNDAKDILSENARWLAVNSDVLIQIEGHGDERGTNDYNLALGERRARSIMRYLVNLGIRESRFSFISYGEERGVCSDKTEDCYQKNRRVHFIVKK
ncbi:MAG: peptidoglycan-associated lipoprotein Pal [Nitrospiria bacterium]